jgi:general stress protein CsbA
MEILIDVPTFLHPFIEFWMRCWSQGWFFLEVIQNIFLQAQEAVAHLWLQWPSYATNVFVPIVAVVLVFWPILLSLIMAVVTAWAWIFWIITSILLGIVQVGYASYQFFMITMDICGLSILKTYTMIRHQFLLVLDSKGSRRKSRRRLWRQRLENAQNYESFLKIRIEPKDVGGGSRNQSSDPEHYDHDRSIDSALPKLGRSNSFSNRSSIMEQLSPSKLAMARNLSFSGDFKSTSSDLQDELSHIYDPIVVQELSRKTADLLVTTTSRLENARLACIRDPNDATSASTMQYLLAGVVKRNHLQLDELLIENARSVAESGQYGLSTKSRHMIRSYYQEVEKCLDYIAARSSF